jgi:pSer/pThr/pTyr-binding forkhead associated (FHA) protein
MNSAAGTLRNGVPVSNPELLEPGDRITLGNLTLRVLQPGEVATVAGPLVDEAAG